MNGQTTQPGGPGILLFAMPFAAAAGIKHADKLIDCLAPLSGRIMVAGDARINTTDRLAHVTRAATLPTLHYLASVRPIPWSALLWVLKLTWVLLRAMGALLANQSRTEVVLCFQGTYYTPVLALARLLGKKTVIFLPGNDVANAAIAYRGRPAARLVGWGMRLLRALNYRLADTCVVESLRLVAALGLKNDMRKVRVGNLYVNTEVYRPTCPPNARSQVVGFVGRLSTGKGILPLLDAAAALEARGIGFVVVGDGPLREQIAGMLCRPDLSHVALMGWADETTLVERLNELRLLVLPSDSEGLPNIVLEAMACGTAVLATPVGGLPDLIWHEVTGYCLSGRDAATIAESIYEALNDPDLPDVAERGRRHVTAHYSLAAATEKWRTLLLELTTEPQPATSEVPA